MKLSSYAAMLLLTAILITPSPDLVAQDFDGRAMKTYRDAEWLIRSVYDAHQLSYEY